MVRVKKIQRVDKKKWEASPFPTVCAFKKKMFSYLLTWRCFSRKHRPSDNMPRHLLAHCFTYSSRSQSCFPKRPPAMNLQPPGTITRRKPSRLDPENKCAAAIVVFLPFHQNPPTGVTNRQASRGHHERPQQQDVSRFAERKKRAAMDRRSTFRTATPLEKAPRP